MFNLQGSELIIIVLLALVVLGPEKLPDAMRKLGQFYAELKKMSTGFQEEFRSVVDEPLKEMRDTANLLRDSADFTKLQDGDRGEKPKSAEMAPADPAAVPTDDVPFTDAGTSTEEDAIVDPEPPRPFSGSQLSSAAPRPVEPTAIPAPPLPFASQAPLPTESPGPGASEAAVTGDDGVADRGPDDPPPADRTLDATSDPAPDLPGEPGSESHVESVEEATTDDSAPNDPSLDATSDPARDLSGEPGSESHVESVEEATTDDSAPNDPSLDATSDPAPDLPGEPGSESHVESVEEATTDDSAPNDPLDADSGEDRAG